MTPRDKFIERTRAIVHRYHSASPVHVDLAGLIADFAAAVERETAERCVAIAYKCGRIWVGNEIRREYLERTEAQPR